MNSLKELPSPQPRLGYRGLPIVKTENLLAAGGVSKRSDKGPDGSGFVAEGGWSSLEFNEQAV